MKPPSLAAPGDQNEEISALIEALHENVQQRLEELTGANALALV